VSPFKQYIFFILILEKYYIIFKTFFNIYKFDSFALPSLVNTAFALTFLSYGTYNIAIMMLQRLARGCYKGGLSEGGFPKGVFPRVGGSFGKCCLQVT